MTAEHLFQRGLRHFAFVGVSRKANGVERRRVAICQCIAKAGFNRWPGFRGPPRISMVCQRPGVGLVVVVVATVAEHLNRDDGGGSICLLSRITLS